MNNLKYLFIAELKDGSIYKQNKEDTSVKFPPKKDENGVLQGKSAMADIREDIEKYSIKKFHLVEQGLLKNHVIAVDLDNGRFEIDGVQFAPANDKAVVLTEKLKLVYQRDRREHRVTQAAYLNPQSITKLPGNGVKVINSVGEEHVYKKIVRMWEQMDNFGTDEKPKLVKRTYILPEAPLPEVEFVLGWETQIKGETHRQVIKIK